MHLIESLILPVYLGFTQDDYLLNIINMPQMEENKSVYYEPLINDNLDILERNCDGQERMEQEEVNKIQFN